MKTTEAPLKPQRSSSSMAAGLGAWLALSALSGCARPATQVLVDATMMSAYRADGGGGFKYARSIRGQASGARASEGSPYVLLAGDLHCHISPPDDPPHVTRGVAETVELARDEGLDFVVLTPHVGARFFQDEAERAWVVKALTRLTREVREAGPGSTLFITGFEYTDHMYGHVGVAFADLGRVLDAVPTSVAVANPERFFEEVVAQGGALVINHPLVTPLDSIVPMARADLSWRPWTGAGPFPAEIAAANRLAFGFEAYNLTTTHLRDRYLLGDTELTLRATLRRLDEEIVAQQRRIAPVGGSDSHSGHLRGTTFVLSEGRSEGAIREALVAGRLCVRDPAACSFEARGESGAWMPVGAALSGAREVDVRVPGADEEVELFVNGAGREVAAGSAFTRVEVDPGRCSVLRVRAGAGFSGPIYVNCAFAGLGSRGAGGAK